jgi:hypothetical protein
MNPLDERFLTTAEAADLLRYDGPAAVKNFLAWADRHRVPRLKRGRTCLWRESVLIAFLERKPWTRLHDEESAARPVLRLRQGGTR